MLTAVMQALAQPANFVSNGGFEEFSDCPERNGDIKKCISWSTTSASSTPDYFHRCFAGSKDTQINIGVPKNSEGIKIPYAGEGYAGLAVFFKKSFYSREYLQNKLQAPLERGMHYKISFYIALSDSSEFVTDHISCFFSDVPNGVLANAPEPLLQTERLIQFKNTELLKSKSWVRLEAEYIAKGGERYLIIGSFKNSMTEKEYKKKIKAPILPCRNHECAAYYFIDNVSVEEMLETRKVNPRYKD